MALHIPKWLRYGAAFIGGTFIGTFTQKLVDLYPVETRSKIEDCCRWLRERDLVGLAIGLFLGAAIGVSFGVSNARRGRRRLRTEIAALDVRRALIRSFAGRGEDVFHRGMGIRNATSSESADRARLEDAWRPEVAAWSKDVDQALGSDSSAMGFLVPHQEFVPFDDVFEILNRKVRGLYLLLGDLDAQREALNRP